MELAEEINIINGRFKRLEEVAQGQTGLIGMLLLKFFILSAMVDPLIDDDARAAATKKGSEDFGKLKAMISSSNRGVLAARNIERSDPLFQWGDRCSRVENKPQT